jgi:hypothetical protein
MNGSTDTQAQLAAAIAGALAAADHSRLEHRAQGVSETAACARAAVPATAAWSIAGRQMAMGRATQAYERRRGH